MRTVAISGATLALALTVSSAWAKNDFEALLGDLTFGETPLQSLTLDVAAQNAADTLKPVPAKSEGFAMPEHQSQSQGESAPMTEPRIALNDPIPTVKAAPLGTPDVDFGMIFDNQGTTDSALAPGLTPVLIGHRIPTCDVESCDEAIICRPHERPSLPSSTLLQYFRSNPCYTHVWDGYQRECRERCGSNHEHLHGECDCFSKNSKGISFHSPFHRDCDECSSCDGPANACDR